MPEKVEFAMLLICSQGFNFEGHEVGCLSASLSWIGAEHEVSKSSLATAGGSYSQK